MGLEARLGCLVNLSKAIVLIFHCESTECFLFSEQEGQVRIVRGLETSWGKYSESSTSEGGLLLTEKKQPIQVCRVRLGPKRPVICVEHMQREPQIVRAKWGKDWARWRFKSIGSCLMVVFGVHVCHLFGLPETININDGWKHFSFSTFHFTNWWTNSLPTGASFHSMCFSHPSRSEV